LVAEERGPGAAHGGVRLARAADLAARQPAVDRRPGGRTVPAERPVAAERADGAVGRGERRAPRVLVEVDDRVDADGAEALDRGRHLVQVGLVVLPGLRLDARPRDEQPHGVPAGPGDALGVLAL